jgi:Bacterial regulatory proteins, tetR family
MSSIRTDRSARPRISKNVHASSLRPSTALARLQRRHRLVHCVRLEKLTIASAVSHLSRFDVRANAHQSDSVSTIGWFRYSTVCVKWSGQGKCCTGRVAGTPCLSRVESRVRDDPKRRSDAKRNREVILAAALDALTESSDVSLNAIALLASVANATLYRHFPTREQLVLAVYEAEVRHLVDAADELPDEVSPNEALRQWVARLAQYAMTKHGLASALQWQQVRLWVRFRIPMNPLSAHWQSSSPPPKRSAV